MYMAWLKHATVENVSPHVKWHSYTYIQVPLYMRTTNLLYTDFIGNFEFRSPQKGNLHFSDSKNITSESHYFLIRNPFLTLSQYFLCKKTDHFLGLRVSQGPQVVSKPHRAPKVLNLIFNHLLKYHFQSECHRSYEKFHKTLWKSIKTIL